MSDALSTALQSVDLSGIAGKSADEFQHQINLKSINSYPRTTTTELEKLYLNWIASGKNMTTNRAVEIPEELVELFGNDFEHAHLIQS